MKTAPDKSGVFIGYSILTYLCTLLPFDPLSIEKTEGESETGGDRRDVENILKGEGSYRQSQKSAFSHACIGQVLEDQLEKGAYVEAVNASSSTRNGMETPSGQASSSLERSDRQVKWSRHSKSCTGGGAR